MAYKKNLRKGGIGGKLGHSNMSHWDFTEVKLQSRKLRRLEEQEIIETEIYESPRFPNPKRKVTNKRRKIAQSYMNQQQVNELIQILSQERMLFYYFKDYYAFLLLSYLIDDGLSIQEIAQTKFSRLLNKPTIKQAISYSGDGFLTREKLFSYLSPIQECYLLTLGDWGEENDRWWSQTSRHGKNLVLQLNFSNKHNKPYHKLIKPNEDYHPFENECHPIATENFHTLAWSRIDISDDYEYALIEEIQNDWIREAISIRNETEGDNTHLDIYIDDVLKPHLKIWDEAMLASTIWLLKEEIGINKIYYHTHNSGNMLKNISENYAPPKSIYTKLPEKFCFIETENVPPFLQGKIDIYQEENKVPIKFYFLDFN
ncbi:hypothetical protein QUF74_14450 [Candidatus Halobeggiatoa sp. HSG11]|nr:hypothetical protein [Candidatus Halobeggiatoa sp. HSG11]